MVNNLKFPRRCRLLTRQNFKHVFDNAKKLASRSFIFLIYPNDLDHPRLGVILSKKKISLAVQRNRVRRLVRESFRQQKHLGGLDIVIIAKHGVDALDNAAINLGLTKEWQRCKRFSSQS